MTSNTKDDRLPEYRANMSGVFIFYSYEDEGKTEMESCVDRAEANEYISEIVNLDPSKKAKIIAVVEGKTVSYKLTEFTSAEICEYDDREANTFTNVPALIPVCKKAKKKRKR